MKKRFVAPLIALGGALYLYANLFASPRVPFLLGGDQAYFWLRAMRMLDGERIYRGFLQFTPPGLDVVFFWLFKIFGLRIWVTNFVVLALGVVSAWLVFSIARRFMRRESAALAAAIFLVPVYGKALNATHHWFGVLAVLAAVWVVLRGVTGRRLAIAGGLLGVASFFSTYHGFAALLAFCLFVVWRGISRQTGWAEVLRRQTLLFGTYVVALAMCYSHHFATGGELRELWYFQVTYVREYAVGSLREGRLFFPLPLTLHNLPALFEYLVVYVLLGAAIAGAVFLCWRRRREPASIEPMVLITLVAMLLFGEVAMSAWWLRFFAVSAPAIILFAWVIDQLPRFRVCAAIALWVWIVLLGEHQTMTHHRMQRAVIDLPAGRVATMQTMAAKLMVLSQFVKPGDAILQAAWPGVYMPLHVRDPLPFDTVNPSDTRGTEDIQLAAQRLEERHVPYVLWTERLDSPCSSSPCSDRLAPLREHVHAAYTPVATLPDGDTLWRRRQ